MIERCLLARFGRGRWQEEGLTSHFELPCRDDDTFLTRNNFMKLMDAYYMERGWNKEDGWPSRATLIKLGLEDVAFGLESIRCKMDKTTESSLAFKARGFHHPRSRH